MSWVLMEDLPLSYAHKNSTQKCCQTGFLAAFLGKHNEPTSTDIDYDGSFAFSEEKWYNDNIRKRRPKQLLFGHGKVPEVLSVDKPTVPCSSKFNITDE